MKLNTDYLDQLKSFNSFASQHGVNSKAIARLGGTLAGRVVTASSTDSVRGMFRWFRTTEDKAANNSVRDLFKETIINLFGGESKIPAAVKSKMLLADYNKGKPLTARRIAKVSAAVIDALTKATGGIKDQSGNKISLDSVRSVLDGKDVTPANKQIADDIHNAKFDNLSSDVQKAFDDMKDEINERCGEGTVKTRKDVLDFVGCSTLSSKLRKTSAGLVRDLNGADVLAAMKDLTKDYGLYEAHKTMERLREIAKDVPGGRVTRSLVDSMFKTIPELHDAVKRCHTPEEYSATIDEFVPQMTARLKISAMADACDKDSGNILVEQFEKMTGIPVETLNPPLSLRTFSMRNVEALKKDINDGKMKVENADDVKKAFVELAQNFVKERMELAKKIDDFKDVPDWARNHLRQVALVTANVKDFHLEGIGLAKQLDLSGINAAIGAKPFKLDAVVQKMRDVIVKIIDLGVSTFGADKWSSLGVDGQGPFASVMFKCALASDPKLIAALHGRSQEILDGVSSTITNAEPHLQAINPAIYSAIQELGAAGAKAQTVKLPATEKNTALASNIRGGNFDRLPQDVQKAIDDIKDEINARCGEGTVEDRLGVVSFARANSVLTELMSLAKGVKRDLTAADVRKAFTIVFKTNLTFEKTALLNHLRVLAKNVEGAEPSASLAAKIMDNVPGLAEELKRCKTPAEFQAAFDKFHQQIESRLQLSAKVNLYSKNAPDILLDEFVQATGLDRETLKSRVDLRQYGENEIPALLRKIDKGQIEINGDEDLAKAFRDVAKDYVSKRVALANEVDAIEGLPDKVRAHLRMSALTTQKVKGFNLKAVPLASQLDLGEVKTAISSKPFDVDAVAQKMLDFYRKIVAVGTAGVGGEEAWKIDLGAEGQKPFVEIMVKCAVGKDVELLAALNEHADELIDKLAEIAFRQVDIGTINNAVFSAVKELFEDMQ